MGIVFLLIGIFAIVGAINNWNLWWNSPKVRTIIWICRGKTGARFFMVFSGHF